MASITLTVWRRREKFRKARHDHWQRLLDQARNKDAHPREDLVHKRDHWSKLLAEARAEIADLELDVEATGIDVSNNNGHVDFAAVHKAGYRFAFLKASEGTTFVDSYFASNAKAAKAAGLRVGAYHFLDASPAAAQAKHFAARIHAAGLKPGDLLPVADVEKTGVTTGQAVAFIDAVHRELGVKPLIYTSPGFARWPSTFGCRLWVAHYGVSHPTIPPPWTAYAAWQHSQSGHVPGVSGACDLNVTNHLKELIW